MSDIGLNIVLIGFMGVGKTTIGRRTAGKLGIDFYDTDEYIRKCEKMPAGELLKKKGEKYFQGAQRFAVTNIVDNRGCLISTGGNTVCDEYNRELLSRDSLVVWLRAKAETVYENTRNSRNKRPEIAGATVDDISVLLEQKSKFYENCDIVIDVDELEVNDIADMIISEYKKRQK
ncbi:MAG: shikimate kinase [Ruminococcaceae bacterium]|nr:shikimate kinase [Oscillospiraceae bacterium]